jgi:hypothetical protein
MAQDFQIETRPLMQHEQVKGNDWYGKPELLGDNHNGGYTD